MNYEDICEIGMEVRGRTVRVCLEDAESYAHGGKKGNTIINIDCSNLEKPVARLEKAGKSMEYFVKRKFDRDGQLVNRLCRALQRYIKYSVEASLTDEDRLFPFDVYYDPTSYVSFDPDDCTTTCIVDYARTYSVIVWIEPRPVKYKFGFLPRFRANNNFSPECMCKRDVKTLSRKIPEEAFSVII